MPIEEKPEDQFLDLYVRDLAAGRERSLSEYEHLFPAAKAEIARHFSGQSRTIPEGTTVGLRPELMVGLTLGPYVLKEELGRGSFGVVFRAEDRRLSRPVALKILMQPSVALLKRFEREARLLARLDHPGICPIHETGTLEGYAYIAMPYWRGEVLASRLASRRSDDRRSGWREDLALVAKIARALHAAHEQGVVHRDIKPGNLLITEAVEPIILDFGLAQWEDSNASLLSTPGEVIGTPLYMSPEQARGEPLGRSTDVWSLGSVLFEMLSGAPPFSGATRLQLLRAIESEPLPELRRLRPDLPRDVTTIQSTALHRSLALRYRTAADLAFDLERVLEGAPIRARRENPLGRLYRAARREPVLASLLLALMAALPTITWLFLGHRAQARDVAIARALLDSERREELLNHVSLLVFEGSPDALSELGRLEDPGPEGEMLHVIALMKCDKDELALERLNRLASEPTLRRVVRVYRADLLAKLGRREEALRLLEDLPPPASSEDRLFLARRLLTDRNEFHGPNAKEALALAEAALLAAPRPRALYHSTLATAAALNKDRDRVKAVATTMLESWPESAAVCFTAGWTLNVVGEAAPSLAAYDRALALRPDFPEAMINRAAALSQLGRSEEALVTLREARKFTESTGVASLALGRELYSLHRFRDCLEPLAHAQSRLPRSEQAWNTAALAHINLGEPEAAMKLLDQGLKRLPASEFLLRTKAGLLVNSGRTAEAIEVGRAAIAANPSDSLAWSNQAIALVQQKDLVASAEHFAKSLELDPSPWPIRQALSRMLEGELRRPEEAIRVLNDGIRFAPDSVEPREELALLLIRDGRFPDSMEHWAKISEIAPEHYRALAYLGRGHFERGDYAKARELLNRALAVTRPTKFTLPVEAWLQLAERAATLVSALPDYRDGAMELPDDPHQILALARVAAQAGEAGSAVRWAESALSGLSAQNRADDEERDQAAMVLLLAASRASPGLNLGQARTRALRELRALLGAWSIDEEPSDKALAHVSKTLKEWRGAFETEFVRDPVRLRDLPFTERIAWSAFWSEVNVHIEALSRAP